MSAAARTMDHSNPNHLAYAVFIAALIHGFVIFGLTFIAPSGPPRSMIEVTLALHRSPGANPKADFLAQANQAGSGQLKQAAEMTTTQAADFFDAQINEIRPQDQLAFTPPQANEHRLIVTHRNSRQRVPPTLHKQEQPESADDGMLQMSAQTAAIASLEARLAEKRQAYARMPRVHTVSTLSTREDASASYIDGFRRKVESMGNQHYPEAARARRLQGEVRLLVAILPSGKVEDVRVLSSSGYGVLDEAARRSVRLAEPFQPFTREMRQKMEVLQIIRTWRFAERMHNEA